MTWRRVLGAATGAGACPILGKLVMGNGAVSVKKRPSTARDKDSVLPPGNGVVMPDVNSLGVDPCGERTVVVWVLLS